MSTDTPAATRPSAARDRLLAAAARIYYSEGIHSVPVDRVIAEAGVTRATFYRHFPSKEELVRSWLDARDQEIRANAAAAAQQINAPGDLLRALVDDIGKEICRPNFRGCSFINAAAEYPDPDHPVHVAVTTHRTWFRETLLRLLIDIGHPEPEAAGRTLVMLRDGAMVAGYLDSPEAVRAQLMHAVETLVADRSRLAAHQSGRIAMPAQAWSKKRERQYEHIKEGLEERGTNEDKAEEIAARTVNKERARSGEAKQKSKTSTNDISSARRGGLRSHQGSGGRTKAQLYNEAKNKGIDGRSKMSKAELERAVGR